MVLKIMNRPAKNQRLWMHPLLAGLIAVGLCAKASACSAADGSAAPANAASRGKTKPRRSWTTIGAAWAVIVGINYRDLGGAAAAEIPPLGTAENDAQAIYDMLTKTTVFSPSGCGCCWEKRRRGRPSRTVSATVFSATTSR